MSLADLFDDAWDSLIDMGEYLFSFEWIGDAWEAVSEGIGAAFTGLSEFSFMGMAFGILAVSASYITKFLNVTGADKQMTLIASMVQYMPPVQAMFWSIASYAGAFLAGYFVGSAFENT